MKKIEAFQLDDGRIFKGEEEAKRAEERREIEELYRERVSIEEEPYHVEHVLSFIFDNKEKLFRKTTRMFVVIEGGLVSGIFSDSPVECIVKDYDYDEEDKNCTDSNGHKYHGYERTCYVEKALVDKTFKEVNG